MKSRFYVPALMIMLVWQAQTARADDIQTTVTGYDLEYSLGDNFPESRVKDLMWLPDNRLIVAGYFTNINGVARKYICRLNADGSVDSSWGPTNISYSTPAYTFINRSACDGTNLYVSGWFTNIDVVSCVNFAKLDADTGAPDPAFTNGLNDRWEEIDSMALHNNALYIGGRFSRICGAGRTNLAKLNASNGQLDSSFTNTANSYVYSITPYQDSLYVGGIFSNIGGVARSSLAKLNPTNGAVDAVFTNGITPHIFLDARGDPQDGNIMTIACFSNALYVGGLFTNIGGINCTTNIAKLNLTNGVVDGTYAKGVIVPIIPEESGIENGVIYAIVASNDSIYASGIFTNIGGIGRKKLAKLNPNDGSIDTAFTNEVIGGGIASKLAFRTINGTNWLYVGGSFSNMCGVSAKGLALIRWQAGSSTSAAPSAPTGVSATDGTYTDKVRVTWTASSGADGYQIWRNTSDTTNSAGLLGTATSTTYDDTTATAGTTYYYWLKATNSYGISSFSSSDSGYRRVPTPGQVAFSAASYTVNENAGSIALTVTRSSGSDGAASVNYATQNGTALAGLDYTAASGTLSWSDGDSAGKSITVTIINRSGKQDNRAFTVGLSGASGAALASPYTATVTISDVWPSTPTGVIASDGTYTDKVLVYWTSVASATSYKVWRGTDNSSISWNLKKVGRGVSAEPSDVRVAHPAPFARKLRWAREGSPYQSEAEKVVASEGKQNASVIGTCTASVYLDTTAAPDTVYYYWIQSVNASGTNDLSAPDSGYCGSIANPATPAGISASDGLFTGYIKVAWQAASGATQYELWRALENNISAASLIEETAGISYNDYSASQGIYYYYWVRAGNVNGYSAFGSPDSGWRQLTPPSGASASDRIYPYHINVAWNPVANTLSYEVWREEVPGANSDGGNLMKVAQAGETYFNDYYTISGVYYRYKIKACNGLGSSLDYGHDTGIRQVNITSRLLPPENDYDGDKLSDLVLFNSSSGILDVLCSALGRQTFTLGAVGPSQVASGDIDGDHLADPLAYYADSGTWLARLSSIGYSPIIQANFGGKENTAAMADYDGDRISDIGVYNETNGVLSVVLSDGSAFDNRVSYLIGGPGYGPVPADYDGDRLADPTVYSESDGRLIVTFSGSGYYGVDIAFGGPGQSMYSADFDGDGKADPVLYEQATGMWTVLLSSVGYSAAGILFGGPNYVPAIGDYDGDGKADPAIYQPAAGQWLIMLSASGYSVLAETFGEANFIPFGPEK